MTKTNPTSRRQRRTATSTPLLLEDFVTLEELADEAECSVRTVQRMIERRELAVTYFGSRALLHVPTNREILRERQIGPVKPRQRRRSQKEAR
jgi:transcriptional antiterminator